MGLNNIGTKTINEQTKVAKSYRADIDEVLDNNSREIQTTEGTFVIDHLKDSEMCQMLFDHEIDAIKAKITEEIIKILPSEENFDNYDRIELAQYLREIKLFGENIKPDFDDIILQMINNEKISLIDRIKTFNDLQISLGEDLNISLENLKVFFEKGFLNAFIVNNGSNYKMSEKNLAELKKLDRKNILRLTSYNPGVKVFSDEDLLQQAGGFSDHFLLKNFSENIEGINKKIYYEVKFDEKEWLRHYDMELKNFIVNDVYKYWKEKNKLPDGHQLDLTQDGKIIEFMYSELLDIVHPFGLKNVFPTSKMDDEGKNGAKCDMVLQFNDVSVGLDLYDKPKDVDKKYRNCILNNPRQIKKWPTISEGKIIVLPIPVKADKIIDIFQNYMKDYQRYYEIRGGEDNPESFQEFRNDFGIKMMTSGLEQEISELIENYSEEIAIIKTIKGDRELSTDISLLEKQFELIGKHLKVRDNVDREEAIVPYQPKNGFRTALSILRHS